MVERNLNDIEDELLGTQTEELSEESTELYEHFRIIADKGQTITRVDKFLQNRIENVSRNRIQQAAKAGSIFVNDKVVKQNYKVKPNDVVSVVWISRIKYHWNNHTFSSSLFIEWNDTNRTELI